MARSVLHSIEPTFSLTVWYSWDIGQHKFGSEGKFPLQSFGEPSLLFIRGNTSLGWLISLFCCDWNTAPWSRQECHFTVITAFVPTWSLCRLGGTHDCLGCFLTSARISVVEKQHSPVMALVSLLTRRGKVTITMVPSSKLVNITGHVTGGTCYLRSWEKEHCEVSESCFQRAIQTINNEPSWNQTHLHVAGGWLYLWSNGTKQLKC